MPRKIYGLISAACTIGIICYSWVGFSQTSRPSVRLATNPTIEKIRPFEAEATEALGSGKYQSPVQLTLQAIDARGQALKNARIRLQILTPPKSPWFTTDFPIVEGTKLLDVEGNAPTGEFQVKQSLPIRGTYRLLVDVTPIVPNSFAPVQQTIALSVPEHGAKYRNLGILVCILLVAGFGGGWVIGSRKPTQPGEIVPEPVRLLMSGAIVVAIAALLFVNLSAEFAHSHESHDRGEHLPRSSPPSKVQSQGLEMKLSGDTTAAVGRPAQLQVSVIDTKTQQPVTDVALKVTTTALENNWVAFAYESAPDSTGKLVWKQQFFDGAPHRIDVEVTPQVGATRKFQPFQVGQTIPVEGVAPPLSVRLISLAYLTGVVGIGLLLGLWLSQKHNKRLQQDWKRSFS
ncbi:hypothetical protein [Altericista sp. CCNU0014]|uniref:hypothetical protein n=1 Tax=Altericista sp. CCNU0014 TaxID=3082949 RepID=UPI00384B547F